MTTLNQRQVGDPVVLVSRGFGPDKRFPAIIERKTPRQTVVRFRNHSGVEHTYTFWTDTGQKVGRSGRSMYAHWVEERGPGEFADVTF
jgi:hypothetical protein